MSKKVLLCSMLLSGVAPLMGANLPADSVRGLDSVTIVGQQLRPTNLLPIPIDLRNAPLSVSRVDGNFLRQRAITDIAQATKFLPNVRIRTSYGAFQQIAVRGFDHAVMMVDGVRDERSALVNSYPVGDLYNVASVEVLKGPASVLFGHSVVGGVVNIVRKQPSDQRALGLTLRHNTLGSYDIGAHAGGALTTGLNAYVGGFYSTGNRWRNTGDKRASVYGALGYTYGQHSLLLRLDARRDFYGTEMGLPPTMPSDIYRLDDQGKEQKVYQKGDLLSGLDRSWRYNNASDFMYNRSIGSSLQYTYQIAPNWKLSDYLSYSYDDIDYFSTESMSYLTDKTGNKGYPFYTKDSSGNKTYYDLDHVVENQNLRFEHIAKTYANQLSLNATLSSWGIKHNLMLGHSLSYLDRVSFTGYNDDDLWGNGKNAIVDVLQPVVRGTISTKLSGARPYRVFSHGISLVDIIEISTQLKAMLSARYDWLKISRASAKVTDGKHAFEMPASDKFDRVAVGSNSYRAGLVYMPLQSLSIYTSVGSFYQPETKHMTLNPNNLLFRKDGTQITERTQGHFFEPISGYQVELGLQGNLTKELSVLASAFYIRRNNEVMGIGTKTVTDNGQSKRISYTAQIGATESRGLEVEAQYQPLSNLRMQAGYGLTIAKVAEAATNAITKEFPAISSGAYLPYIPKHTAFVSANYLFARGVLSGLSLHGNLTYTSKMEDGRNTVTLPAVVRIDCGAGYEISKQFSLGLQLDNLLDNQTFVGNLGSQLMPNPPRNLTFSLSYRL